MKFKVNIKHFDSYFHASLIQVKLHDKSNHQQPLATEIERKWLLNQAPTDIVAELTPIPIDQGYIAVHDDKTEVRVRKYGTEYWQTIKSPGHISRKEFEIPISQVLYKELFELTNGRNLQKNRFIVPYSSFRIEIDQYLGHLSGLWVAEVEFENLEQCNSFDPPNWFGKEITGQPAYKNYTLASIGLPSSHT